MLNTLAQIQQVLQKDQFTESDIEEAEYLISKYLNQVDTNIPDLKRKAETHLLCHMLCTELDVPYISPEEACIYTGSAIKTQRNELANIGDAVKFHSAESESMVGIFKEALVVKKKRSAEVIYAVKIQILEKVDCSEETGCPLLWLKDGHIFKHPCKIIQLEEVFHNCKDVQCPVKKDNISNTMFVKHREFNSYILNRFRL